MLYDQVHQALIAFSNGSTEQEINVSDDLSLYLSENNGTIKSTVYIGNFKIDLGIVGNMFQSYVTVTDSIKSVLGDISYDLSCLQLSFL